MTIIVYYIPGDVLPVAMEVERGCEEEGMPRKMFTTSKAIPETSSKLSIEVAIDGVVVRLVSLEEGPASSMKNETLLSWDATKNQISLRDACVVTSVLCQVTHIN